MIYQEGKFENLSTLDQMHYNKWISKCNQCNPDKCMQDMKYQVPVIVETETKQTILAWKYCNMKNIKVSIAGDNSPINQQKPIDKMLGDI